MEIPLKCRCGKVRGAVANAGPERGCRLVCYCDDCQKSANHLGSEGVLDELGGTDIYQTTPAQVTITEGADELKCCGLVKRACTVGIQRVARPTIKNDEPLTFCHKLLLGEVFVP